MPSHQKNTSNPLVYGFANDYGQENQSYYVFVYFAELQKLKAKQYRAFNIFQNDELWYGPLAPDFLSATTISSTSPVAMTDGNYTFSFVKLENSTLPPILNAVEIYKTVNFFQSETDQDDGMLLIPNIYIYIYSFYCCLILNYYF